MSEFNPDEFLAQTQPVDQAAASGDVNVFDPDEFLRATEPKHDPASRLETLSNVSTDKPEEAARFSGLARKAGVTYDVAKVAADDIERDINRPDWKTIAGIAPKVSKHIGDNPAAFDVLKNDAQKLAEVEQSRSTSNNDPQKHGLTDLVKGGLSPLSFSALQKDVIDAYSYFKIEEHQAWLRHLDAVEKSKSWDEARQEVDRIRSMPKSQQYSEFHNLTGQQVTDSHLDKNKNLRNSYAVLDAVAGGIGRKKSREERAKYPDADKTYNEERSVLGEMSQEKASDADAMKVKGLSPYSPEWFVQEGLGSVAQTGKSIATASVPGLGIAMFYGSVGGAYLNDKEHASLSDADKLEGARVHAGAEYIGESLGTGKLLEVIKDSGMHALKKWMYAAMANGTEEHATEIVTQTYDAAKRGEIPSLNPEEANDASYFDKTLAFIDGQLQAYVLGAIGGGAAGVGGSAVQSTGKAIVGRIDARIKAKKQAVIDKHNSLLGEVQKVEEMDATHLDSVTVRNALESMDDNERSLYVDPSQLLNQEGLSRQQVEALMPSVSLSEINQALQVGGTIKVPRNELITNLAATKDLDNESITRHFKEDPTSDSKYEMEMAGIDGQIKQADILIAKSADSEKLKTQRSEVYQQALKDLNESGMFKGGNDKRASIWAAMATATAIRTGMAPMDLYKQAFGRVTDEAAIGDAFNQYAGQKAQGADLTALQRAKQAVNSGADAEQTRQETGWFRGPDNKWRFEIDDSKAVFKGGPTAEDAILRAVKAGESGNPVMLADVLRHESLFAAYPELKNIEIRFTEKGEKSRGAYSPESNVIAIRGDLSAAEAKSTLLHEIQHAIQGHEGFARGGNENEFTDRQEFGANVEKLSNQISAIMEENPDAAQAYRARNQVQMEARNPDGKYVWTDALIAKLEAAEKVLTSTEAGKQLYELDLERSYDKNTVTYSSAFDQYRKLHGEIEARDTQARADMSAEDRMASKPYISQGIPDDQVIVRFGGNGQINSIDTQATQGVASIVETMPKQLLFQNKATPRGTYDPSTRNINLTHNADLSTFLHESGHMFLDIMVDMSLTENASESLKKDMDVTMRWFGIDGDTPGMRLYNWSGMSINEKRQFHEKWAESFEQYLFEGKAPSIELAHVFSSFRQWLLHVYKSISQFVSSHDGAKLNDEVRGVFDRMLATEEQIQEAEAARGMLPLFDKKPDNMTDAEWEVMQQAADDYARSAFDQMTARSLRDMKWLSNAKNKTLRKLQREADAQRREAHMEARQQILSQNIYRAWQFLKAPVEGAVAANKKAKASKDIDSSRDSLLTAIAKLGGLNMEQAVSQYGLDSKDFHHKGGMFSMPVLRKTGGMSPDAMGEALSQYGYLPLDEHGKWDILDLEDKLREEAAGRPHYSTNADYDVLLGETQYAETPDADQVDFIGGRLSRQAIREMYDDADLAGMQGEQAADSLALEGYTQSKKVDGGDNERQYVLFGDEAQGSGDGSKRKAAKKSSGNVDSTKTIPGRYATIVGNEVARKIDAGFDKLDTPEKIAYATSHITRNPQEVLLVVATDKNHKPISILRHAIGMKDSASVDQGVVAGWATNVQGAAHVWISHNHPSGKSDISEADRRISGAIGNLLDGTGIEYHGIMAVTHEGVFSYDNNSVTSGSNINNEKIPAPEKSVSVNVVEREFKSTGKLHADKSGISDLASAIKISEEVSGGESGVVLLDAQYRPVGFMPIDFAGAKYIRGEKLQSDLLSAIELTNALAVVSYTKDTSGDAEIGIKNVGGLLSLSRVTPLDVLVDSGQAVRSWAYQGEQLNWGTFRQQNGKDSNDKRTLESMGVLSDEGLHPDTVADLFGLSSGDELVRKLLTMPDPVAEIERLTDEIMLQRHADLATPEARERAAEAAIHNEAHVKFLATELTALNRAIGKPRMVMAAAKEYAAQIVSGSLIKDLNTGKYEAAEVKAGRAAEQAFISGNKKEAARQKRNQVLHAMTVKMVNDAKDEMEKHLSYLKKFDKFNKKIDPDYQEQIDTLLERYDLRKKSLKAIQRSQNLGQWIEQQKAMGLEPVIPDKLLDESQRTNYKLLTVEEMRGLVDAVKNIEHLGRLKNRLLTDKAKRELNALADAVGKSITDNGGAVKPVKIERNSTMDRLSDLASGFFSMHRKLASIVRQLDGWKDGGLLWETMIRPMNEAGDNEAVMHEKSTLALAEVFAPLKGKNLTKKMYIPMIANSLSYEGRLAVALNWGNEGNRQRLMDGDNWGVPEVGAILATLTADDWKFVQGVWDHIATYKDAIGEQQKRLTGIEPSWVDATPFEIKSFDGQMVQVRGGYYPAKYDTTRSTQALSNEAAGNVFDQWKAAKGQGKTRDGFTKSRATQVVDRPIRKDFGVITQHITEVTHRLAWQDWVVDMNRLLKKEQVDSSIRAHYGNEILEEMRKAIEDITTGDMTAQSSFEKAINHLRIGTTIVGLGYNLTTSLLQPFGLTQSMVRIGPKWVAKGLSTWIGNPARMNERTEWVYSKSDFMRLRGKTMMREMNEILNSVRKEKLSKLEASYFYGIQKMQVIADMPTWLGQYEKSMAEFDGDESKAIALADQAVLDAQGGGQNKDLSRIQRGGPLLKLWTNFYSFFNTTYNLTREVAGRTDVKDPASVAKAAVDMLLLYSIPAVMGSILKGVIAGDDDDEELADRILRDQMSYLFGTMVGLREISAAFSGFSGYQGPAGTRFFSEVAKFGKQVEQGEADAAFLKSLNNIGGIIFHYPAGQINRTVEGANALMDGETDNMSALIFGKPK